MLTIQFIARYFFAFLSGIYDINPDVLINGFSNPRFFGQLQVLALPFFPYLIQKYNYYKKNYVIIFLFITLCTHWCIAISLGGRGLWLSLITAYLALLIIKNKNFKIILIQIYSLIIGIFLFYTLFHLIPDFFDIKTNLRDNLRGSLSARDFIWQRALEMAQSNPFLGVGPMHFSATLNPVAAHPHQMILQWLAEWGFIATLLVLAIIVKTILHSIKILRNANSDYFDGALWVSIIGTLILAQVDGVFVMPYTETWLAIIVGIAIARWNKQQTTNEISFLPFKIITPVLIIIFCRVLIYESPNLSENIRIHASKNGTDNAPRFWSQGWIPMQEKNMKLKP